MFQDTELCHQDIIFKNLSVLLKPALQFLCIDFSIAKGVKLLFTLIEPIDQVAMFLQKLG